LSVQISAKGYKWGEDVTPLLYVPSSKAPLPNSDRPPRRATLPDPSKGFTLLILSDTLWLHDEHSALIHTISKTLSTTEPGFAYFTTGHYAKRGVVDGFFKRLEDELGMESEELVWGDEWEGKMPVDVGLGPGKSDLSVRKAAVWSFRACRRGLKPR
jgi:hypothetical protein